MTQDKKTIAFDANPETACVALGLAMGFMPRALYELERDMDSRIPEEKKAEIMDIIITAFRQANVVAGTHEKMIKDKKFMAEMEEIFGELDLDEAI